MPSSRSGGFTLVELAVVLIITALLLGAVLKARELIISSQIRQLLSEQDGFRAAYFGFYDRFRALPGDYSHATTNIPGITGCAGNGDGNGRIEGPPSAEHILVWEHLSRAGFINGSYTCNASESISTTPTSQFAARMRLAWDNQYADLIPSRPARHNLKSGGLIPSNILAEIDRKIDDGSATGGTIRFSDYDSGGGVPDPARCFLAAAPNDWNSSTPEANCGMAFFL